MVDQTYPKIANWIGEVTDTQGTATIALRGAFDGFASFEAIQMGSQVYYSIENGDNRETGIGTLGLDGTTRVILRTEIDATLFEGKYTKGGNPIPLKGASAVYCAANAHQWDVAITLVRKLNTIEPNAKDDQDAAEVPYHSDFASNVQDALDLIKHDSLNSNGDEMLGNLEMHTHSILGDTRNLITSPDDVYIDIGNNHEITRIASKTTPVSVIGGQEYKFYSEENRPTPGALGAYTKEEVNSGFRPSTWTPTAHDVGAYTKDEVYAKADVYTKAESDANYRAHDWMPTATQVGAYTKDQSDANYLKKTDASKFRPSTWTPTASDVGAIPTSDKSTIGGDNAGKMLVLDSTGKIPANYLTAGSAGGLVFKGNIDPTLDPQPVAPSNPQDGWYWVIQKPGILNNASWGNAAGDQLHPGDVINFVNGYHVLPAEHNLDQYFMKAGGQLEGDVDLQDHKIKNGNFDIISQDTYTMIGDHRKTTRVNSLGDPSVIIDGVKYFFYTERHKPDASTFGALPLDGGGTVGGNIILTGDDPLFKVNSNTQDGSSTIEGTNASGAGYSIYVGPRDSYTYLVDKKTHNGLVITDTGLKYITNNQKYDIFTKNNPPTASEVGALPADGKAESAKTVDTIPNASATVVGGIKIRLDGQKAYITTDGSAP